MNRFGADAAMKATNSAPFTSITSDDGVVKRILIEGAKDVVVPKGVEKATKVLPKGCVVRLKGYDGKLNASGEVFDASSSEFSFVVGRSEVISGFSEACCSMRHPGEVSEFIIRFDHAYGTKGLASAGIPPRADLRFKIELKTILNPSPTSSISPKPTIPAIEDKDSIEARRRRERLIEKRPDPSDLRTVCVGGEPVTIDALGPLVLNKNGTLSRITNWTEMNAEEQSRTIRIIGKRNRKRRIALSDEKGPGK